MNELTRIILSSFHPYDKAMFPNLLMPIIDFNKCLTILKRIKMVNSSNCTCSPWMIQFIYISIYTLCFPKI